MSSFPAFMLTIPPSPPLQLPIPFHSSSPPLLQNARHLSGKSEHELETKTDRLASRRVHRASGDVTVTTCHAQYPPRFP